MNFGKFKDEKLIIFILHISIFFISKGINLLIFIFINSSFLIIFLNDILYTYIIS